RELSPSLLCQPRRERRHFRPRAAGLRAGAGSGRRADRGGDKRGAALMRAGRRSPLAPDPDLIRTLAKLLDETGLTDIEYACGDQRIHVSRQVHATSLSPASPPASAVAPP